LKSRKHSTERENQAYDINKIKIALRVVLCNNFIISVVPPGFQMAISLTARLPNSQAQRKKRAISMYLRYVQLARHTSRIFALTYERSELLPD
jgi:hypothetical protein